MEEECYVTGVEVGWAGLLAVVGEAGCGLRMVCGGRDEAMGCV